MSMCNKRGIILQIERRKILDLINEIEDATSKMFHEILPDLDKEFHEDAYSDYDKLQIIKKRLIRYKSEVCNV